ncbi:hypothetical protein FBU30_010533 [Linnemannia zychae]|nr:hypothetical protein FBU30_010533 [Linnemannia zychae]
MVPQHDIHIIWPHPVPSGNAFIAGTWSVPGHGPWEMLPMTRIPGSESYEIHLDVQEIEDISDYLDEDGYLHHELLDHHHAHDHTHQGSSPPLAPTTTSSPERPSRRKRISRFFGRARSSSSASTTSSSPKDPHIDLPYHHQSKDGTILPLVREYRYQYKFVIDGEWKCDNDRAQVYDPHGNLNHELVVELIEQLPTGGRSRSSSLQSQHGPQLAENSPLNKPLPNPHPITITTTSSSDSNTSTTTNIIVSPAEDDKVDEEVIENATVPNNVATVDTPVTTTSSTTKGTAKSRDTFEPVFITNETDDLSDGEGRSKRTQTKSGDKEQDKTDNINNAKEEENVLLGEDVVKTDVIPQQDDHASLSPADRDNSSITDAAPTPLINTVVSSDEPAQTVEEKKDSDDNAVLIEDNLVNSSSIHPQLDEPSTIAPIDSSSASKETPASILSLIPSPASVAIPNSPVLSSASNVTESHLLSPNMEPETFVLQAAVNLESSPKNDGDVSEAEELEPYKHEAKPAPITIKTALEVNTNPAAIATSVVPASTTNDYQVPSPPLTPSNSTNSKRDLMTEQIISETGSGNQQEQQEHKQSVYMTPRTETTITKHTTAEETNETKTNEGENMKVNNSHDKDLSASHLSRSSSSSSLSTLAEGKDSSRCSSNSSNSAKTGDDRKSTSKPNRDTVGHGMDKKSSPEQYPNLLWSFCKTTAVVSAAVVILGLGLGRKRD